MLSVVSLAISEFLPYAGGYKLVLHLLLVISVSCYYSYEVSSWIGNLSWSLGSLMPSGLSPLFSPIAVIVEYFSQIVRPFALALRMTLHGLSSIALMECLKYVFYMLASWAAEISVESCSVFVSPGAIFNLNPKYWYFLWDPQAVWLGLSDNVFYLIAAWALLWLELVELILMVVQVGVFLGLFLFFSSEHPQEYWAGVKKKGQCLNVMS
uniref:ATP synthase subunit 6 n=1 Tax=Spirobranchus giganteus TaxID=1914524 RepID=A0A1I9WKB9_9ANNE|nr:ATP synthase F0 subunit 6 [Spirobranchus giganteus]APA32614.1 ATP synthase subunit 6 [Spirobranchus giganteus]